jgi:hypothetical protein
METLGVLLAIALVIIFYNFDEILGYYKSRHKHIFDPDRWNLVAVQHREEHNLVRGFVAWEEYTYTNTCTECGEISSRTFTTLTPHP